MAVKFNVTTESFIAEEPYPRKSPWKGLWLDPGTLVPNCPHTLVGFGWAELTHSFPSLKPWEEGVKADVSTGALVNGTWKVTGTKKNRPKLNVYNDKIVTVNTKVAEVLAAGFTYEGVLYSLDQGNMTSTYAMLSSGITNAHGGYWRAQDNSKTAMTDDEALTFFASAYAHGATAIRNGHVHKDALKALLDNGVKTAKQIYEYDISTGWPGE